MPLASHSLKASKPGDDQGATHRPGGSTESSDNLARIAFIDFEASSLGKKSFPIEVAWVVETGEKRAI